MVSACGLKGSGGYLQAAWLLLVLSVVGAYLPLSAAGKSAFTTTDGRRLLGHKGKHSHYKRHDSVQQVPTAVWRLAAQVSWADLKSAAYSFKESACNGSQCRLGVV